MAATPAVPEKPAIPAGVLAQLAGGGRRALGGAVLERGLHRWMKKLPRRWESEFTAPAGIGATAPPISLFGMGLDIAAGSIGEALIAAVLCIAVAILVVLATMMACVGHGCPWGK